MRTKASTPLELVLASRVEFMHRGLTFSTLISSKWTSVAAAIMGSTALLRIYDARPSLLAPPHEPICDVRVVSCLWHCLSGGVSDLRRCWRLVLVLDEDVGGVAFEGIGHCRVSTQLCLPS